MEIFKLFGSIGIKNQDANRAIDETTGRAESASGRIGETFKKMAGFLGTLFAGKAIFDFGKSVVEAAATAKAINSQFDQVFDGITDLANDSLKGVAKEVGALPNRIKPAFNQIASFAKVAGMDSAQALDFTSRATRAAADSAAFYDKSLEDTTETLKSYLKGNFAVADNLGILSTETTRNAKATELFGQKYSELSGIQQQEVLMQMFEDANRVSGAMGQASREADGFENVMGNLKQAWQDFKVIIGGPLLAPVVSGLQSATEWMTKAQDFVTRLYAKLQENGAIQSFKAAFDNVKSVIDIVVGGISDFVGSLLGIDENTSSVEAVATAVEDVAKFLEDATGKVKGFVEWFEKGGTGVDVLKSAVVGLTTAWTGYQVITGIIQGIETVKNTALALGNGLMLARFVQTGALTAAEGAQAAATMGASGAFQFFNTVLMANPIILIIGLIAALVAGLVWFFTQTETGRQMWQAFMDWLSATWSSFVEWGKPLWQGLADWFAQFWEGLKQVFSAAMAFIGPLLQTSWENIKTVVLMVWDIIKTNIETVITVISGIITAIMQLIKGDWSGAWETIKQTASAAWDGIKSNIDSVIRAISSIISNTMGGIRDTVGGIWDSIKSKISDAINGAKDAVKRAIDTMRGFFNFSWSLPRPSLPRFSVSGGQAPWGFMGKGSLPSIGIEWFAKGGIMNQPTLFGMNGNNLMAGGEAGPEAILPLNEQTLKPIGQAIAEAWGLGQSDNTGLLLEIIELLKALLLKEGDVYLDLEKVGRLTYKEHGRLMERGI